MYIFLKSKYTSRILFSKKKDFVIHDTDRYCK